MLVSVLGKRQNAHLFFSAVCSLVQVGCLFLVLIWSSVLKIIFKSLFRVSFTEKYSFNNCLLILYHSQFWLKRKVVLFYFYVFLFLSHSLHLSRSWQIYSISKPLCLLICSGMTLDNSNSYKECFPRNESAHKKKHAASRYFVTFKIISL